MRTPPPDPEHTETSTGPTEPRFSRGGKLCIGTVLGLGLLLWARLIVLSDMPRTAIAEEETPAGASDKSTADIPASPHATIPSAEERGDRETGFGKSVFEAEFGSEADKSPVELTEDPE